MLKLIARDVPPMFLCKSIPYSEMNPVDASGSHCEVTNCGLFSIDTNRLVVEQPFRVATYQFGWRACVPAEAVAILRFVKLLDACGAKPDLNMMMHDWATRRDVPMFSFLFDASSEVNRAYYALWPVPSTLPRGQLFSCHLICNTVSYQRMDPTILMHFRLIDQTLLKCLEMCKVPERSLMV